MASNDLPMSSKSASTRFVGWQAGPIVEITGGRHGHIFRYEPYLALLRDDRPARPAEPLQTMEAVP